MRYASFSEVLANLWMKTRSPSFKNMSVKLVKAWRDASWRRKKGDFSKFFWSEGGLAKDHTFSGFFFCNLPLPQIFEFYIVTTFLSRCNSKYLNLTLLQCFTELLQPIRIVTSFIRCNNIVTTIRCCNNIVA